MCFIGKLIVSKGIDLLLAAWPLVPDARLVVVGFGGFRDGLLELLDALAEGDRDAVRAIARAGRELEGGPRAPLRHLLAFLETADDDYWAAARDLRERVVLTGRLEHDELAPLLAACEALVFPSTFPEAYGMVAAEAAACGVLPISAGHSGAKEVSAMLADGGAGAGARLAVVRHRRRRGASDRHARARVAGGPGRRAGRHAGRARGHGARALLVGGRGRGSRRGGAGTVGGAAARGLR